MAQATTIKSGMFRVLLGSGSSPITYAAPCGFTQRSMTLSKNLEEVNIPDCDDPDKIDWIGRDATSLSMAISGEGVLAEESVEDWADAAESTASVPVKVELEFPTKTLTWTGYMHVESMEMGVANGGRATNNISMQSDGQMVRVVT
jgi:hypothetical protein